MEFVPSNKGNPILCNNNFMYTRKRAFRTKVRWECIKRKRQSCMAVLCTDLNLENPVMEVHHNHEGSVFDIEKAKVRATLKSKALQSGENPKHIVTSVLENLDGEVRARLGSMDSLTTLVMRHQRRGRLKKPSLGKAEQDLELPEESAKIANAGTSSHTSDEVQQGFLCPGKLEPNSEAFLEVSPSVQEHDDPNPAGKKRRHSRGNPGAVRGRKRQRKRVNPEVVQQEHKLMEPVAVQEEQRVMQPVAVQEEQRLVQPVAVQEEQRFVQPVAVQEEQRLVQPVAVQEEQRLVQPAAVQEEQRLVQPVAVQEEQRLVQPVAVQEEQRLVQPVAVQEEQRFVQPVAVQEEQRFVQPVAVQEEQRLVQPAAVQEEQRLVQPVAVQEEQRLVQPVTVQEEQQFVQPVAIKEQQLVQPATVQEHKGMHLAMVQDENKRMQPEAVYEQECTSPEAVQGEKPDPFISDPVQQEPEPGSPVNSFQELACAPATMEQVQESGRPGMILEHRNPKAQEKENVYTMTVQELPCASPVQEPESTSSEAVGVVQELSCFQVVEENENANSGAVQEWYRPQALQGPQVACSEVAPTLPCVPAIQGPGNTSSGTFQELASVVPDRASPDGIQKSPTAQNLGPDSTQDCPGALLAPQPAILDYSVSKTFSHTEDLQHRLEVVTGERDSLLYAKSKWEEEKLILTNQIEYLVSENASLQQHVDTLTRRAPLILSAQEDWKKWKANIGNEMDRILSEQMKLHEEKRVLESEMEAFKQEKAKWEMQIISFQHERDSFQFEKLKWEEEKNYILEHMNSFVCKPQNYYGDSGMN